MMSKPNGSPNPLSAVEFQVLLVLADGPSYGYAIMKAVEDQSDGRMRPEIGSLYRVLSRLMARGLVDERSVPKSAPNTNRGLPRTRRIACCQRRGHAPRWTRFIGQKPRSLAWRLNDSRRSGHRTVPSSRPFSHATAAKPFPCHIRRCDGRNVRHGSV